ncbi:ATP-dependent DNA ligase [Cryobacterium roopkundense]|uniref:DUF7882 domain-containing protein n=2 Tax=Cryobacterium roopkundense TaxID=1001240 RepID=A0A7W9E6N7_9MICO|nr:ATP-dependent DNA ligase [Cryobacterium roopkundense]MBB5643614.1 hypothetical protein [Cryobacterium roopkundense]
MGKFMYGTPATSVEFDDRTLAHLKVVIIAKLRRGESFTFTWANTPESGGGHNSIWLNPSVPLQFEFYGSKDPLLNRTWLEELVRLTNTPAGLHVVPEPPEVANVATPAVKSALKPTATQGTKLHGAR